MAEGREPVKEMTAEAKRCGRNAWEGKFHL
jgi:hypothetical protein